MSYPTIVYKCPGVHQLPGGTYDYMGVEDEDAMKEAITCGWFKTIQEAEAGEAKEPEALEEEIDEISPPTREELEQQAKELGIKFDGRTSDEKLADRIEEALAE